MLGEGLVVLGFKSGSWADKISFITKCLAPTNEDISNICTATYLVTVFYMTILLSNNVFYILIWTLQLSVLLYYTNLPSSSSSHQT